MWLIGQLIIREAASHFATNFSNSDFGTYDRLDVIDTKLKPAAHQVVDAAITTFTQPVAMQNEWQPY